jgi:hypothetical protein
VFEIEHLFQCVIGNGDFRALECSQNTQYPATPELWSALASFGSTATTRYIGGGSGFKPNTAVKITLDVRADEAHLKYIVNVKLQSVSADTLDKVEQEFAYVFPSTMDMSAQAVRIGMGVIDPSRLGTIGIVPISLKLVYPLLTIVTPSSRATAVLSTTGDTQ